MSMTPESQSENMNTFVLQIKGDTSFSLFSQVTDAESLSQTWKLCSKVAGHLEQGKRLENLSWRLFHLHSIMTGESAHDKAHTFERLSKETGIKLDRERHLRLSQLQTPPLKRGYRVTQPMTSVSATIHHPTLLCSLSSPVDMGTAGLVNCTTITSSTHINISATDAWDFDFKTGSINLESFLSSFSPLALWGTMDYLSEGACRPPENNYEKRLLEPSTDWDSANHPSLNHQTSQDPLLMNDGKKETLADLSPNDQMANNTDDQYANLSSMESLLSEQIHFNNWRAPTDAHAIQFLADELASDNQIIIGSPKINETKFQELSSIDSHSQSVGKAPTTEETAEFSFHPHAQSDAILNPKVSKVGEKRKRRNPMATRLPTFVGVSDVPDRAPGDASEEPVCDNCRGTHTPLWRRGPNDELLCNACGVFYKVHKKHRPATLSKYKYFGSPSSHISDTLSHETKIQCNNCSATATPMWRKAPDGSLLCNACALYFKCHKRPRPASSSKPSISRPLDVMSSLSNIACGNQHGCSLGIPTPTSKFFVSEPAVAADLHTPFINCLGNALEGGSIHLNEFTKFEFFKPYTASCYASPNI